MDPTADGHGRAHSAASSDASRRQRDGPVRSRPSRMCVTAASPAAGWRPAGRRALHPRLVPPARRGRQRPQLPLGRAHLGHGAGSRPSRRRDHRPTATRVRALLHGPTGLATGTSTMATPACRHHAVPSGEPSLVSSRSCTRGCAVEFRRVAADGAGTPRSAAARSAGRPRPGSRRSAPRAPAPGRATRRRPPVPRGLRW